MLVLETALPAKFAETIREALDIDPPRPSSMQGIESLARRFQVMPPDAALVKRYIREYGQA
jgi:threonine synthase